jgi:hypothetical protein
MLSIGFNLSAFLAGYIADKNDKIKTSPTIGK